MILEVEVVTYERIQSSRRRSLKSIQVKSLRGSNIQHRSLIKFADLVKASGKLKASTPLTFGARDYFRLFVLRLITSRRRRLSRVRNRRTNSRSSDLPSTSNRDPLQRTCALDITLLIPAAVQ